MSSSLAWDDDAPKPKAVVTLGEPLDRLSTSELDERIAALRAEIVRVEGERSAKKVLADAAAALFGE
jgi:uncharacterized small protein (DUF1192 family)